MGLGHVIVPKRVKSSISEIYFFFPVGWGGGEGVNVLLGLVTARVCLRHFSAFQSCFCLSLYLPFKGNTMFDGS